MNTKRILAAGLALLAVGAGAFVLQANTPVETQGRLRVHEWGTFTALDDAQGRALRGINTDDEPVPDFVHRLNSRVLTWPHAAGYLNRDHWRYAKGVPTACPQVTLRLETPVIYFYPPVGQPGPSSVDVDVSFRGGWLSEFFPNAEVQAPGLKKDGTQLQPLTPKTVGSLAWHNVRLGTRGAGPMTKDHVWLAPRKVQAMTVTANSGESEKFLFYRGVGAGDAPLAVSLDDAFKELTVRGRFAEALSQGQTAAINALWLVEVRADGATAYRALPPAVVTADNEQVIARAAATFESSEFAGDALERLRGEMHAALVRDGLYDDEATALLNTWQRAYFRSPGLRMFFLVPRAWTDHVLPLRLSVPADVTRVMVGRIELVSPEQRRVLARLAAMPISGQSWIKPAKKHAANWRRFFEGHEDFGDLGVTIPPDYRAYLDLGRFRNAIVLDEARRRPTASLRKFVENYCLADQFRLPPARRATPVITARK